MTDEESLILAKLKNNNEMAYITPDGRKLYVLVNGRLVCFYGIDFNHMNDKEINTYIVKALTSK